MKSIRFHKRPKLKDPVLVAAWAGMGDVALKAAHFLKDQLNAQEFAELLPEGFFHPSSVCIDQGLIGNPEQPKGKFYFAKHPKGNRDLIIFISELQPFVDQGYAYAREIISFCAGLKVKRVYTFAAMPAPIEHTQTPDVCVAATKKGLLEPFVRMGLRTMAAGQISGMNGLLLGVAKENATEGICLLGEIPLYTIQVENPLASMAVLTVFSKTLGFSLDFSTLKSQAERINGEIAQLIEYLKGPGEEERPIDQNEIDIIKKGLAMASRLPQSVRRRIEALFVEAREDLSRVHTLKKELDEWGAYEQYEDRFLDLFRKPGKKDN